MVALKALNVKPLSVEEISQETHRLLLEYDKEDLEEAARRIKGEEGAEVKDGEGNV